MANLLRATFFNIYFIVIQHFACVESYNAYFLALPLSMKISLKWEHIVVELFSAHKFYLNNCLARILCLLIAFPIEI